MNDIETHDRVRGGRLRMRRSRGAASGFLLVLLGIWGALVPFVGPSFDFGFSPGSDWTAGRGWLEVLPGAVTAIGGALVLVSRNRATAMLGTWLAVIAGAWFVVGRAFAGPLALGDVGTPVASTDTKRVWLELTYFYGLGALIVFLGALALGRLSVRTVRDVEHAQRRMGPADDTRGGYADTRETYADEPTTVQPSSTPVGDREPLPPQSVEPRRRGLLGRLRGSNRTDQPNTLPR